MSDPVYVDGIELSEAEREAWDERVAICVYDGHVTIEQAEQLAAEQIRRMRNGKK